MCDNKIVQNKLGQIPGLWELGKLSESAILRYRNHQKIKGNVQFVQKVTFEFLMDFKQNTYRS